MGGPAHDPLLPHAYLQGGCVSGALGIWRYVCDNTLLIWRSKHGWFDEREACTKKIGCRWRHAPQPTISQNPGGGGRGGGGRIQGPGPDPPPPRDHMPLHSGCRSARLGPAQKRPVRHPHKAPSSYQKWGEVGMKHGYLATI